MALQSLGFFCVVLLAALLAVVATSCFVERIIIILFGRMYVIIWEFCVLCSLVLGTYDTRIHVRTWSFDTYVPRTYDCTCSSYSSSFFNPVEFSTRQSTTYTCVVVYVEPPTIRADTCAFSCKNNQGGWF